MFAWLISIARNNNEARIATIPIASAAVLIIGRFMGHPMGNGLACHHNAEGSLLSPPPFPAVITSRVRGADSAKPQIQQAVPFTAGAPGKRSRFKACCVVGTFVGIMPLTLVTYCLYDSNGGEGGIRTHGTDNRTLDFESSPFDHSGTSPST